MKHKALFLDRDGVINDEVGFLQRPEDVRFVDGIFSLCRTAQSLGYKLVIVTNQSGIARGFFTAQTFEALMEWMRLEFAREGVVLDAVYHCPYHPELGIGPYKREHEDRKPSPGMLLRAERELGINLGESVMVGDRCTDVQAANAAGLSEAFLIGAGEAGTCVGRHVPIQSLGEAEAWLKRTVHPG